MFDVLLFLHHLQHLAIGPCQPLYITNGGDNNLTLAE